MNIQNRISAFARLGEIMTAKLADGSLEKELNQAYYENQWFTPENSQKAILAIATQFLDRAKLGNWINGYDLKTENQNPKTIGLVMAGNIPLVGWQDLLCVLITGNKAQIKLSSKDTTLPKLFIRELIATEPGFQDMIQITDRLGDFDAVIATGSDNTNRYFEYYFGKYPHILRRNRNSVAVLTGEESETELAALGEDIFAYFGLGCRNVSKLYVPQDYDFNRFFPPLESFGPILMHKKYANNYDYNKSLLLLNKEKHLDNGFLLLRESPDLATPVSLINYQYYNSVEDLKQFIQTEADHIQCIVSRPGIIENSLDFGNSQNPALSDYADGEDVLKFLIGLK
jgi:hypothetical protein